MCGDGGGGGGDGGGFGASDATGRGGDHGSSLGSGDSSIGGGSGGNVGGGYVYGGAQSTSDSTSPGSQASNAIAADSISSDADFAGINADIASTPSDQDFAGINADIDAALAAEEDSGITPMAGAKAGFTLGSMFGLPAGLIGGLIGGTIGLGDGGGNVSDYGGGDPNAGGGPGDYIGQWHVSKDKPPVSGGDMSGFIPGSFSGGGTANTATEELALGPAQRSNSLKFSGDISKRRKYDTEDDSMLKALMFDDAKDEFNKSIF